MMYRTQKSRTQSRPSLITTAALACVGALAYRTENEYGLLAAIVTISFAFVSFWDWMIGRVIMYRNQLERPYIPSDDVRILEAIRGMNDNQLSAAFAAMGYEYTPPPELEPVVVDPEIAPGITKSYAISQTDKAARRGGYLAPIRATSEGSPDRRKMQLLVEWLAGQGLIKPAAGNKPAQLIDYHETRERLTK